MDCSPLCSSVHGILQARVLEWVAISFSMGSSWPRDRTRVSCTVGRRFTLWARESNSASCRSHSWSELGPHCLALPHPKYTTLCYGTQVPVSLAHWSQIVQNLGVWSRERFIAKAKARIDVRCPKDLTLQSLSGKTVMEKGHRLLDQLLDLLIVWWWGKSGVSRISTFWFQPVWSLYACGGLVVTSSWVVGS